MSKVKSFEELNCWKESRKLNHFLYISKGSAGEIRSQLYLAYDLNYIEKDEFKELQKQITNVSKMISGLIKYLENSNKK